MKRKNKIIFAFALVLAFGFFFLASCNEGGEKGNGENTTEIDTFPAPTQLTEPAVVLTEDIVTWNIDGSADKYEISVDGNLSYIESSVTSKKLMDGQTFKIRAIGDGVNFLDSNWSNSVTYVKTIPKYTITWKNGDTVLETDSEVEEGIVPTYDGVEPARESDAQYSYVFTGWTPEVIAANGDATYYAVYTPVIRTYSVTWMNDENILEVDETTAYGTMPEYNGAEPQKAADEQYVYVFNGWSPNVSKVTGDITYNAQFASIPNSYTIVWKNGDVVLEIDESVGYGSMPSYDGTTPTKKDTAQYTFEFCGWTPQINPVTESVTYEAQFTATIRSYIVTFYTEDGSVVLDKVTVEYGSNAVYSKPIPVKNPSEAYTYIFEKWVTTQGGELTDDLTNVTDDRTVYASFKHFIRKVTVYFVSSNSDYGTVSVSTINNVPYGSEIVVSENTVSVNGETVVAQANTATDQYTYSFIDWSTNDFVGHDTIITANFERKVQKYTVTWMNGEDVLEIDTNVDYGAMPVYNGSLPTKAADAEHVYTFTGWSPSISAVTCNIIYVAQFSMSENTDTENNHTVTFYDDDGTSVLGVVVVKHDATASYPNSAPVKQSTAALTFSFDKWVSTLNGDEEADLTHVTTNIDVYAKYTSETRKYRVIFCDWDGSVLAEQSVAYGQAATAPEEPYREDYRFNRWDVSFENIVADTRITATYVRQYTVKFVDYDNSIIEIQLIDHGADATQPADPVRKNHAFNGWNTTFTNIVSDVTVKAQYIRQYIVTFVDYDGTVLATDVVNSGSAAISPTTPTRVGYTFISWNQAYNNISTDMEIVAVYEINRYTVTFVKPNGSVIETLANVAHGTTITPPTPNVYFDWNTTRGYRFTGWRNWNETQPIVGNITVVAEFAQEITEPIIAIETVKIAKGTNSAEISVYLCGKLENIYGISLNIHYVDLLVIGGSNSSLIGAETTVHAAQNRFDLSWADGQGMSVSERTEILTFTFSVDKFANPGEYLIEMLAGTYIIDESLSKIVPVVVDGQVIITE